MNPFEFVIAIIALYYGYKLVASWMSNRGQYRSSTDESANAALVQRLQQLEERVQVLERIVTDDGFELKQQFKDLAR